MSKDYKIGYRKPPKSTQFKPGQSGNPRGRSKGTKNLTTDLREEVNEKVNVREGDKINRISKQRATIKALQAKALKGDVRAIEKIINLNMNLIEREEQKDSRRFDSVEDHAIVQNFLNRNKGGDNGSADD